MRDGRGQQITSEDLKGILATFSEAALMRHATWTVERRKEGEKKPTKTKAGRKSFLFSRVGRSSVEPKEQPKKNIPQTI